MSNVIYKFIGEGDGVPGLPHEVSETEAAQLGVTGLLKDAIGNGVYVEKSSSGAPKRSAGKTPSPAVSTETGKE